MIGFDLLEVHWYNILDFYHNTPMQGSYATMIIMNNLKILKTRERRLRKMLASDGSSD
jgi:hypothetical protein